MYGAHDVLYFAFLIPTRTAALTLPCPDLPCEKRFMINCHRTDGLTSVWIYLKSMPCTDLVCILDARSFSMWFVILVWMFYYRYLVNPRTETVHHNYWSHELALSFMVIFWKYNQEKQNEKTANTFGLKNRILYHKIKKHCFCPIFLSL